MFTYSSTSSVRRCFAASWLGLAVLSMTFDGLGAGGGQCKFDLQQYQERRITAIKGQILSKLGLMAPPTDNGPDVIPKEDLDKYNITATLLEEKYQHEKEQCAALSGSSDDYFAQIPILYEIVQSKGDIIPYVKARDKMSEFFKFDLSTFEKESGSDELSEAEFRLYQVSNDRKSTEQQIDLFQLVPSYNNTEDPTRIYLTSWTVSTTREGWLSHDVTGVVRQWLADPDSNLGFEVNLNCGDYIVITTTTLAADDTEHRLHVLFADPRGIYPSMPNGRGDHNPMPDYFDSAYNPRLVVMAPANHTRGNMATSRRNRRSNYEPPVCDTNTPNCCLRPLVINFRRDLKWNWIRQPRSYSPNFCAGSCPYIRSADTTFTSVLTLYKHLNPDASPSPCCSPRSFKPLTILYYKNRRPETRQLNNMIIENCRCS